MGRREGKAGRLLPAEPQAPAEGSALAVMGPPLTSALSRLCHGFTCARHTVNGSLLSLTAEAVSALLLNQL